MNRALASAIRGLPKEGAPAVVAPLYWTGLTVVRALRAHGVPVIALDPAPRQPSAYTRLCRTILTEDGGDAFWETLLELGDALADRRPVLFLTTDHDAVRAMGQREELAKRFRFRFPEPEVFTRLVDKLEFAEFALRNDLPIPQTFVIRGGEGWERVLEHGEFPLVVKPKYRTGEWRAAGLEKVYKAGSKDELRELLRLVRQVEGDYVVQEWIPGPETQLHFHITYVGEDGEPLVGFSARKLRQWPPLVGSTSASMAADDPAVEFEAMRLLKLAGLRGLGSVEFKRDPRDGQLKIMEPSVARVTLGGGVALANGTNLYYRAYCDLAGIEPEPEPARPSTHWFLLEHEAMRFLARRRTGDLTWRDFVAAYRGPRRFGDFSWRDPLPLVAGFARLGRELLTRKLPGARSRRRGDLQPSIAAEGGTT